MALKDKYFTISEAADELGVTRQTISRWIKQEKFPVEKVGRETFIKKNKLLQYQFQHALESPDYHAALSLFMDIATDYVREKGFQTENYKVVFTNPNGTPPHMVDKTIKFSRKEFDEVLSRFKVALQTFLKNNKKVGTKKIIMKKTKGSKKI